MSLVQPGKSNPRADQMLQVTVAITVLATTAVPLRLLARWKCKADYAMDDWFMVGSLIPLYAMAATRAMRRFTMPNILVQHKTKIDSRKGGLRGTYRVPFG